MSNDIKLLNIEWRTQYSLTNFEYHFGLHGSVIYRPQYVWFLVHLYVGLIPNSSGNARSQGISNNDIYYVETN